MLRRSFLASGAALLAAPSIVQAQNSRVLRFIPQADVTVLDPIWTTAYVTRNHGMMVFDMLYGYDAQFRVQPQMDEGHTVSDDGRTWNIKLRPGLLWHDGEKVVARDCVASIQRWGKRDTYGISLMAATDELSAPDDTTIRFRLKQPFPLLTDALGKPGSAMCAMMPERLARTDPFTQVTEMVGSGPVPLQDGRARGRLPAWCTNASTSTSRATRPPPSPPAGSACSSIAWSGRWCPTPAPPRRRCRTAKRIGGRTRPPTSNALLARSPGVKVEIKDPTGNMACMRLNELIPPFDNPAIRRALLKGIDQSDYAIAVAGEDPKIAPHSHRRVLPRHADGQRRRARGVQQQARLRRGEEGDRGGRLQG